jgi:hypothetical protein
MTLWGGIYHPIIPVYKKLPESINSRSYNCDAKQYILGYLEAFDPDKIISLTKKKINFLKTINIEIIDVESIWEQFKEYDELHPNYGVGVFELLDQLYKQNFTYVRKDPLSVKFLKPEPPDELKFTCLYGTYPSDILEAIQSRYEDIEIDYSTIKAKDYLSLLDRATVFPRRLTNFSIEILNRNKFYDRECIFIFNANKTSDLISLWNLRASGRRVLPVDIHEYNKNKLGEIVTEFINDNFQPHRYNKKIYTSTAVYFSPSMKLKDAQKYWKQLDLSKISPSTEHSSPYNFVGYPCFEKEWDRKKNHAEVNELYAKRQRVSFRDDNVKNEISFHPVAPDFMYLGCFGRPRYVNEINYCVYGEKQLVAEVLPQYPNSKLTKIIEDIASFSKQWRIGRDGIALLLDSIDTDSIYWTIPNAERVFKQYMHDHGHEIFLSPSGRIQSKIFNQLDGSLLFT